MEEYSLWLETDYFEKFRCKGGACRNSCCEGWRISVSMKEYFDLIGRDCSPELHRRLESAFVPPQEPSPEKFRQIAPNWLGMCPMHGEDGLCMLHKECGEGALPEICRVYPRSMKNEGGINQACCSCSCEAVVETLMQEKQLHLRLARLPIKPEYAENSDQDIANTCAECLWTLQDRDLSLPERLRAICDRLKGDVQGGGDENQAFARLIRAVEDMEGNSASMRRFADRAAKRYAGGNLSLYRQDIQIFVQKFPMWVRWFENVLANHLVYMDFPFVDGRISTGEACRGLCVAYALMGLVCAGCEDEAAVADALAGLYRMVEHSPFYYNARLFAGAEKLLDLMNL